MKFTTTNRMTRLLATAFLITSAFIPAAVEGADSPQAETGRQYGETSPRGTLEQSWLSTFDISGFIAAESRAFAHQAAFPGQDSGDGVSLVIDPEFHREWDDGDQSFTFQPFARLDSVDGERSHLDVRELAWRKSWSRWDLTVGISRVFWGVTESQHLVDIVNQTDQIENPDGEDKLGQPMVRLTSIRNWGIVDAFVLPGFRERTLPGIEDRLRPGLPIDSDSALYESGEGDRHVDWALRYSHALGPFDFGLSYFSGTSREPMLLPSSEFTLIPYYPQIRQTGLDLQATLGSWLLKTEAIRRTGFEAPALPTPIPATTKLPEGDFTAATYGFEYTFWSFLGTNLDLGAVGEHLWDERGDLATTPFQNDVFAGTRLAFNDVQSTEILGGVIYDLDNQARLFLVEASRRLGSNWRLELEMRGFSGQPPTDPLASLRTDDYFQLSIQRHF